MSGATPSATRLSRPGACAWRSQRWSDLYLAAFAVLLVGAMAGAWLASVPLPLLRCAAGPACAWLTPVLPGVVVPLLLAANWAGAALVGPIACSPAEGFWVLATPADRGAALAPQLSRLLVVAAGLGLVAAALLAVGLAPAPGWLLAAGATPPIAAGLAVRQQQGRDVTVIAGLLIAGLAACVAGTLQPGPVAPFAPWVAGLAASVLAGALGRTARGGLESLDRFALAARGMRRRGLGGAVLGVDTGLLADLVSLRLLAEQPGRRIAVRGREAGALARLELARVTARSPRLWWSLAALAPVLALIPAAPVVIAAAPTLLVPAFGLVLTSLRWLVRSPGLARLWPLAPGRLRLALTAPLLLAGPVVLGLLGVSLVTAGVAAGTALMLAASAVVAGAAGALRWATAGSVDFGTGYVMTDAGAVPVAALRTVVRGLDVTLPTTVALAAGVAPTACLAGAALTLGWVVQQTVRGR